MSAHPDNVAYLRQESEPLTRHVSARQIEALRKYWEAKYGPGPNTEVCMAVSSIVLIVLHCIAFPFFLLSALGEAIIA